MPEYDLSSVGSCVQLMLDQKDKANRQVIFQVIKKHDEDVAAQVMIELHKIAKDRGKTGRERLMEAKDKMKCS